MFILLWISFIFLKHFMWASSICVQLEAPCSQPHFNPLIHTASTGCLMWVLSWFSLSMSCRFNRYRPIVLLRCFSIKYEAIVVIMRSKWPRQRLCDYKICIIRIKIRCKHVSIVTERWIKLLTNILDKFKTYPHKKTQDSVRKHHFKNVSISGHLWATKEIGFRVEN